MEKIKIKKRVRRFRFLFDEFYYNDMESPYPASIRFEEFKSHLDDRSIEYDVQDCGRSNGRFAKYIVFNASLKEVEDILWDFEAQDCIDDFAIYMTFKASRMH